VTKKETSMASVQGGGNARSRIPDVGKDIRTHLRAS